MRMLLKFFIFYALIALGVADVTELKRAYLPPPVVVNQAKVNSNKHTEPQPQQQQQKVQHVEVLRDEVADGNAHAITDVPQSLAVEIVPKATTKQSLASVSAGDPYYQPSFGGIGVGGFPVAGRPPFPGQGFPIPNVYGPVYAGQFAGQGFPGQGFPFQGLPGQGYPGQSYPGQGFTGQGFPGQVYPVQVFPGQAFPGQSLPIQSFPGQALPGQFFPGQGFPGPFFPGQGFPGQGFPPPIGGFPGVPFSATQQSGEKTQSSDDETNEQLTRIASDTVYGTNCAYVYQKPK
ncbi:uncharacterized protein [Eurosta solidaginis]|uniref:uncharacterized protein n=1 Tax=Eurosta solidaginis TaxID=178769 RepID=UPI003530D8B4